MTVGLVDGFARRRLCCKIVLCLVGVEAANYCTIRRGKRRQGIVGLFGNVEGSDAH